MDIESDLVALGERIDNAVTSVKIVVACFAIYSFHIITWQHQPQKLTQAHHFIWLVLYAIHNYFDTYLLQSQYRYRESKLRYITLDFIVLWYIIWEEYYIFTKHRWAVQLQVKLYQNKFLLYFLNSKLWLKKHQQNT